ncbi:MAG: adenosine kinase [Bacteroidales bacterium]|nr:adenosine kinase [Bacteroidales bacterium]
MGKILGMGNALVDIMIRIEDEGIFNEFGLLKGGMKLVDAGFIERLLGRLKNLPMEKAPGGSAANTMNGLANLGIETGFIGKVAEDDLGRFMEEDMLRSGIKPLLYRGIAPTGIAVALVTPDSERTFAVNLGCAIELTPEDITETMFEGYDIFHIEGYLIQNTELLSKAILLAKNSGALVSLDLASFDVVLANLGFLTKIINDHVDIVFANEDEARAFTGLEPEQALHEISKITSCCVVKIGEKGSLIHSGEKTHQIGVIKANSIDTTGAGDLYAAGFLYGMANQLSLETCGRVGALLAGKVIEVMGAKMSQQSWDEIRHAVRMMN